MVALAATAPLHLPPPTGLGHRPPGPLRARVAVLKVVVHLPAALARRLRLEEVLESVVALPL
eukprot:11215252-Alexandrium_andersonii.AAC.1